MNIGQNIQESIKNVRSNTVRSILTVLIIAFGITALIGVHTAIDGLKYWMTNSFSTMGSNTVTIKNTTSGVKRHGRGSKRTSYPPITYEEALEFREKFSSRATVNLYAAGSRASMIQAKYEGQETNQNIQIFGSDSKYLLVANYTIESGRNLGQTDEEMARNTCIIGAEVAKLLFPYESPVDKIITAGGKKYNVVGVFATMGSAGQFGGDKIIMVPISTFRKNHSTASQTYNLNIYSKNPEELNYLIDIGIGEFRQIRGLKPYEAENFSISKSDNFINSLMQNLAFITITAKAVALITLFSASIALMNIMLVSVTERTREIGIRKALGATKKKILTQFLTEAIVICQLGGILGIFLGILSGNFIGIFFETEFYIPWNWIIFGLIICTFVGLVSGIYPANKAAGLDPIESLRHE